MHIIILLKYTFLDTYNDQRTNTRIYDPPPDTPLEETRATIAAVNTVVFSKRLITTHPAVHRDRKRSSYDDLIVLYFVIHIIILIYLHNIIMYDIKMNEKYTIMIE